MQGDIKWNKIPTDEDLITYKVHPIMIIDPMKLFLITTHTTNKVPFTINNLFTHNAIFKALYLFSVHISHKCILT